MNALSEYVNILRREIKMKEDSANTFITKNDPVKLAFELADICKSFNTKRKFKIINILSKLWILKVKYPLFEYRVKKLEDRTVDYLFENPSSFITILNRYIIYFITYCRTFNLSFQSILDNIFQNKELELEIFSEEYKEGIKINNYNIITRFNMPTVVTAEHKYTISKINIDLEHSQFELNQVVYDTEISENYLTAKVLYQKYFKLDSEGNLYNPNYFLNKSLLDEDLKYCKYIIMHIMAAIGSIFEATSKLYFIQSSK